MRKVTHTQQVTRRPAIRPKKNRNAVHHLSQSLKESLCLQGTFCGNGNGALKGNVWDNASSACSSHRCLFGVPQSQEPFVQSDRPFKLLVQSAEQLSGLSYLSARCGEHLNGLSAPVCDGCNTQLSVWYAYCRWSDTLTNPVTLLFTHLIYITIADQKTKSAMCIKFCDNWLKMETKCQLISC